MKVKYIGESFGSDSLTNGKIYMAVEDDGMYRVVDDSDEDYLYSKINPAPLDGSAPGGKWEIVEQKDEIRKAERIDIIFLASLASLPEVWGGNEEELREDFEQLLDSEKDLVAVAEFSGKVVGFANIRLRSEYVAGTKSSPVAYLEGIAVSEEFRGKGIAKKLFEFCADWAKEKGCKEFGSDCLLTNEASYAFHMALGFKEIERTVHFAKTI